MAGIKWILASDIDGTLVGHGGETLLATFLAEHPEVGVVYLTGRTRANAEPLIRHYRYPLPLALATDIGSDVYWGPEFSIDERWAFEQRRSWSPGRVMRLLQGVDGVFYRARSSHWRIVFDVNDVEALGRARSLLAKEGVACRTLWDGENQRMDIVPRGALKGQALKHILTRLNMRSQQCFVAGDAENDGDLFEGRYRGVLVANGSLKRDFLSPAILRSPYPGALGVLHGLRQFLQEGEMEREFAG